MSYTDLLESKHHYLIILKESDASRREIEKNLSQNKVAEYNKIMTARNTAFINLIKEGVPFVEDDDKECIRIVIDDMNYDMKKEKLHALVGDTAFEEIMARSHEHASALKYLKDNNIEAPSDTQYPQINGQPIGQMPFALPPTQPVLNPYQQPMMMGGYQQSMMPIMNPYGMFPYPNIPQVMVSQDNSKVDNAIDNLNKRLNEITEKMQPQIKEVVIDEQIQNELNASKEELAKVKQNEAIARKKAESALETIQNIRADFDVERIKHEMLIGNYNLLSSERDSLRRKLDAANEVAEIEREELNKKIEQLAKEKDVLIKEKSNISAQIKDETEKEIKKQKALLDIELQKEIDKKEREIQEITQKSNEKVKEIQEKFAKSNAEYEEKLKASNKKIEEIEREAFANIENEKQNSSQRVKELEEQMDKIIKERENANNEIQRIKEEAKQKEEMLQKDADEKIKEAIQSAKTTQNEDNEQVVKQIQMEMVEKVNQMKEKYLKEIDTLKERVKTSENSVKEKETEILNIKKDAENSIQKVKDEYTTQIKEMQESIADNQEVAKEMEQVRKDAEARILQMQKEFEEREQQIKDKEAEITKQAQEDANRRLREMQSEYDKKRARIQREHEEEIKRKQEELEHANTKIQESEAQIELLNESLEVHKELAFYDSLTGLKNKNAFNKEFMEKSGSFTFVRVGINGMKEFNKQGRAFGDNVIKFISSILNTIDGDVYRIIGDDFGIVTTNSYEKVSADMNALFEKLVNENMIYISYGIQTSDGLEKGDIIKQAELKMNQMREKNRIIISSNMKKQEEFMAIQKEQEHIAKQNETSSFISINEVELVDGKLVSSQVDIGETDYEKMVASYDKSRTDMEDDEMDMEDDEIENIAEEKQESTFNMDLYKESETDYESMCESFYKKNDLDMEDDEFDSDENLFEKMMGQ